MRFLLSPFQMTHCHCLLWILWIAILLLCCSNAVGADDCSCANCDHSKSVSASSTYSVSGYESNTAYVNVECSDTSTVTLCLHELESSSCFPVCDISEITCFDMYSYSQVTTYATTLVLDITCDNWFEHCPVNYQVRFT